ncbi:MAG: lysostaphin resistance A-like protein [Halobacteriaceae archaeon]
MDARADSAAPTPALVRAVAVGVAGLFGIYVWGDLLLTGLSAVDVAPGPVLEQALGAVAGGLGTASVAYLYLRWSGRGLGFVDVGVPGRRDVAVGVAGVVVLFAVLGLLEVALGAFGVQTTQHAIAERANGNPAILLALVPLSWLLVGPGEELLYRNVVQKSLYGPFSRRTAVLLASAVFAVVHVPAYYRPGASTVSFGVTILVVCLLSVVLGVVYDRTRNVAVSAAVHGTYDAVQFALLYATLTGLV